MRFSGLDHILQIEGSWLLLTDVSHLNLRLLVESHQVGCCSNFAVRIWPLRDGFYKRLPFHRVLQMTHNCMTLLNLRIRYLRSQLLKQ